MESIDYGEGRYRVLLSGIGDNTEEKRDSFCKKISEIYGISLFLLKKITADCPTVLKKNLTLDKAVTLAKKLKSFGALVSVQEKRDSSAVSLEFQEIEPHLLALESSYLQRTPGGAWNVIGRVKNISGENLNDTWVLIQLFDDYDEFLSFQEVPVPINPLPSNGASPFKVVFEGDLPLKRVSIAFKNSSGTPLPTLDQREKKEWAEVKWEMKDEEEDFCSSPFLSLEDGETPSVNGANASAQRFQPSEFPVFPLPPLESHTERPEEEEKIVEENVPKKNFTFATEEEDLPEKGPESAGIPEPQVSLPMTEDIQKLMALWEEESPSVEAPPSNGKMVQERESEPVEKREDLTLSFKMIEPQEEKVEEGPLRSERLPAVPLPEKEGPTPKSVARTDLEPSSAQRKDIFQEARFDISIFEEASKLLEEISKEPVKREREEPPPIPWIEDFRNSVENYYRKTQDPFSSWFKSCQSSEGLDHPYRSLLTILAHARFHQKNQSEKAFENTQRVFKLLHQPNLTLDEIPLLEGTPFFTGENWTDLFHRALPRLQQMANRILEKKKWNALDLERLIQIIPHMSDRNSRLAIRWIHQLIPEVIEIDSSTIALSIGESLYRVGSRLGVVDPHFDTYHGKNSIGDLKLQSFAKTAFPQSPWKIEGPMTWVGIGKEEGGGGYCLPTEPQCEGCLFEIFCPKLHPDFNPSEKGMKTR
jgi:hypothetical protein